MKLLADLHTHSKFSRFGHGKSTIEEMARRANEIGLEELAITDHGLKHFFRTSKTNLVEARQIIDEINTWSKTRILLGVEADIISENGDLDIDEEVLGIIDILVIGYHKMISTDFAGFFGGQKNTNEAVEKATRAYLNAIDKYPVTFISHIDSILTTDLYRIGMACKNKGIFIEINNRHATWTQSQVDDLIASDCMFVVSSDAHSADDVGNAEKAFELIKKYKIPEENIANVQFDESELTDEDKENRFYQNLYESLKVTNPKLYEEITASMGQKTEKPTIQKSNNKGALSKEMEDALEKIAFEQGINDYERKDGNESIDFSKKESLSEENLHDNYMSEFSVDAGSVNANFETREENYSGVDNFGRDTEYLSDKNETEDFVTSNNLEEKTTYLNHIEHTTNIKNNDEDENLINIQNSMNQYKIGIDPNRIRDDSYKLQNNQEEQLQMLKSYKKDEFSKEKSDYIYEQKNKEFFEDDFGSQNFNVNTQSDRGQRNSTKVEINKNYNTAQQKFTNSNKPTGNNFYNQSTFAQTENQQNSSQTEESEQLSVSQKKSNGFVSFSNFIDDDK